MSTKLFIDLTKYGAMSVVDLLSVISNLETQKAELTKTLLSSTAINNKLLEAIRRHRDYRGDDRCYQDDGELYSVLPEGDTRPAREVAVTLINCDNYIKCRQQGREYVSPQRRIEELEAKIEDLEASLHGRL